MVDQNPIAEDMFGKTREPSSGQQRYQQSKAMSQLSSLICERSLRQRKSPVRLRPSRKQRNHSSPILQEYEVPLVTFATRIIRIMSRREHTPKGRWFKLVATGILNPRILKSVEATMFGYGLIGTMVFICLAVWIVRAI